MSFLDKLERRGCDVWIRHVVVPDINDNEEDIARLAELVKGKRCVKKVELLPFKSLCIEKYKALKIPFPLENTPQMSSARMRELEDLLEKTLK